MNVTWKLKLTNALPYWMQEVCGRILRFFWYRGWLSFTRCYECGKKLYMTDRGGMKWRDGYSITHYSCAKCSADFNAAYSELEKL